MPGITNLHPVTQIAPFEDPHKVRIVYPNLWWRRSPTRKRQCRPALMRVVRISRCQMGRGGPSAPPSSHWRRLHIGALRYPARSLWWAKATKRDRALPLATPYSCFGPCELRRGCRIRGSEQAIGLADCPAWIWVILPHPPRRALPQAHGNLLCCMAMERH